MIVGGKNLPAEVGKSQPKPRSAADVIGEMARAQNELAERNQLAEMEGMSAEEMFVRGYKHWLLLSMYAPLSVAWTRVSTEADKWIRRAAEQGNADAQHLCGKWEDSGGDYVKAAKWFRRAAEQGHAEAMHHISDAYWVGRGVPLNRAEAEGWKERMRLAQGGHFLHEMESPEKKQARAEAMEECRNLAARGNIGAQYAFYQMSDLPIPGGGSEAEQWLRRAAEQGHAEAQGALGDLLSCSTPTSEEAVKWYRRAAEQGDAETQARLGSMYFDGDGVPQDSGEAVKWYRRAAEQGHAEAQCYLGEMFVHGASVARDDAEAEKWIKWWEEWGGKEKKWEEWRGRRKDPELDSGRG